MPRALEALHEIQSMNKSDRVTEGNTLVEALVSVAEALEEGGHDLLLVRLAFKIV